MTASQIPSLIFLMPFLASMLIPFFRSHRRLSQGIALASVLGSLTLSIFGICAIRKGGAIEHYFGGWLPPYGIAWRFDSLSAVLCLVLSTVALFVIASTGAAVDREIKKGRIPYYMIVLLHLSALFGMILTHDLFNLFVFLEVASLTAYALIATGDDQRGNVASFRYLLIGTVGASFYLLGVGYLYAATGTLNMSDLIARLPDVMMSRNVSTGIFFILVGLAIKMGLFPFHGWLPDAYTYASDSATALIAPVMTKTAVYALIRIFFLVLGTPAANQWGVSALLTAFGTAAIVAGSFMAFFQAEFKRMLAYSSVSHIGLISLALGLNHPAAFTGAILHIINHALMKTVLFLIALSAYHRHGVHEVLDFSKLRSRMPFTLFAFAVAGLSMVGVPPLCGFFSKWYILIGAVQSGRPWAAAVVVISSLLTALYFFRILEQAFFQKSPGPAAKMAEAPFPLVFSVNLLSFALLVLGLMSPFIFSWGMQAFPFTGS